MHVQRGGVGVTALDRHLYAVGGNDGTSSLDSCERYDPLLNKWKMIKPMCYRRQNFLLFNINSIFRAGAGVCVMDGYLYALGGFDDNSPLSTCERYNPANDSWENLPTMGSPRGSFSLPLLMCSYFVTELLCSELGQHYKKTRFFRRCRSSLYGWLSLRHWRT